MSNCLFTKLNVIKKMLSVQMVQKVIWLIVCKQNNQDWKVIKTTEKCENVFNLMLQNTEGLDVFSFFFLLSCSLNHKQKIALQMYLSE